MKSKTKTLYKIIAFVAIIVLIAMIILIPPVGTWVAKTTGIDGSKLRGIAQTVVAAGIGLILVMAGIAAMAVPIVGVTLILIGVGAIAWAVWPLFRPTTANPTLVK